MKILHIGNFAPYDSPLGYCPNAEWISKTFKKLGHKIDRFNESDLTSDNCIALIKGRKPNMILVEEARLKDDFKNIEEKAKDELLKKFEPVITKARKLNIPVVAWLTNLFYGIMRREIQVMQNPIFKADIVFSTDGGHQKEFDQAGVNHICLRQGIYKPEAKLGKINPDIKADIVFIGAIYEHIWAYRDKLVKWLEMTYGKRFAHYGQRGEVRHEDLANMIASVKIVIGDSVYSPHYWSNRIYEMIGRGAFFIHPKIAGLEKEFIPYKHFIPYDIGNFKQLKQIIDYYLTHDKERNKIRLAGFEHCKKYHTYEIRVKKMLEILKEKNII